MKTVLERLLSYVTVETTSNANCESCPSSEKEWALARMLAAELKELGVRDARVDEHCYVYGSISANVMDAPIIGLIAHMDTSDAAPGAPVHPRVVHYEGGDIVLNEANGQVLTPDASHIGHDLVVTDGLTLLGADDKAGVAEIMTFVEYVLTHPQYKHGKICIGFTPDEEIGRGADLFDVEGFGADFAYTLDGGAPQDLEYENFNAAAALVVVHGFSIHPGSAKNRMRNASTMAMEFHHMLPVHEVPEATEGYEGFYHLCGIQGQEQEAKLEYILRDHDSAKLEEKKNYMRRVVSYLNAKYGEDTFDLYLRDSYSNMREKVEKRPEVIERAKSAIAACGLEPRSVPIRGGTDGARLSFMGLVCPNLGTGGANFHGVQEYASVQEMNTMVEILKNLVQA